MITTTLSWLDRYRAISPNMAAAIDYVLQVRFEDLEDGQYPIRGEDIFMILKEYDTKLPAECRSERHRQYADIQIMVRGTEVFGFAPLEGQEPVTPFTPDGDVAFFSIAEEDLSNITLTAGQFIIFFPEDIHRPDGCAGSPERVRKAVVKVRL